MQITIDFNTLLSYKTTYKLTYVRYTYTCSRSSEQSCFEILAESVKFYLAFENSNSVEYNTKKIFFNSSGNNCTSNTFIHVEIFSNPKHLADYFQYIDKNNDLYNSYFKWKGTGKVDKAYFLFHSNPLHKSYDNLL